MGEESSLVKENTSINNSYENMEEEEEVLEGVELERDPERNPMNEPLLLKRNKTLSSNPLALVGAKVSYIESLDYE